MAASQKHFPPELNEKGVIELLENATPGSIKKATNSSMKIFQGKNIETLFWQFKHPVSQSKTMRVETVYTFKNYLYIVTSGFLSQDKVEKICLISWWRFYNAIIPLALVGYEMIIANEALRASVPIYHLISNALSWNN